MGIDPCPQLFGHERLGDVVDRAGVERAQQQFAILRGGQENHRYPMQLRLQFDLGQQFEAVHARHHHVQQQQVGDVGQGQNQRLFAGTGGEHFVAIARQQRAHRPQVGGLVVDDQNAAGAGAGIGHGGLFKIP